MGEGKGIGADAVPLVEVALGVVVVAGVHAHHQVEFLHPGPERIELGQGERLATLPGRHRGDPNQKDLGSSLVNPLELLDGAVVAGGQADDRGGVDGAGIHERPVLVHPLVEGVGHRHGDVGIVSNPPLQHAGQSRPQQGAVDAHVLHESQPRLRVEEGVDAGHGLHPLQAQVPIAGGGLARLPPLRRRGSGQGVADAPAAADVDDVVHRGAAQRDGLLRPVTHIA